MAFVSANTYRGKVSADVVMCSDGPLIRANCGDSYFGMDSGEAVKLRDDLSRAILEAAQASAKAAEGETA